MFDTDIFRDINTLKFWVQVILLLAFFAWGIAIGRMSTTRWPTKHQTNLSADVMLHQRIQDLHG